MKSITRRSLLGSLFLAPFAAPRAKTLVVVFLRGGADGLNMVVPHAEDIYYSARPLLAIPRPDESGGCIDLDGQFGFHPAFEPLLPYFRNQQLAILHAVGSNDDTRSHFEAQDQMERGDAVGGWLARHLRARAGEIPTAISAISISTAVPESLRGAGAAAIRSLSDLTLASWSANAGVVETALASLYSGESDAVSQSGARTLDVLGRLKGIEPEPEPGAKEFQRRLAQIGALIKADVGLEVACVDLGGWDSHFFQAALLSGRIRELAEGLAGFCDGLGDRLEDTTILVQTEFGRRVYENGSLGTDHGRGGVMLLLGGGVRGGRVISDWPGLSEQDREGPGDLRVTIDYRHVLAEVLSKRFGNNQLDEIFPGFEPVFRDLLGDRESR